MKINQIEPPKTYFKVTPSSLVSEPDYKSYSLGSVIFIKSKDSLNTIKGVYMGKSFFSSGIIIRFTSTGIIDNGVYGEINNISLTEIVTGSGVSMILHHGNDTPFVVGRLIDLGVAEIEYINL